MIKSVSIAALLTVFASASFAGSLKTNYEQEPEKDTFVAPAGSSGIGTPLVIGGVIAAVAVAALIADDKESATDSTALED